MGSDFVANALVSFRCPYCVLGLEFRPMRPLSDGHFCEHCGHTEKPRDPLFRCSCPHCVSAAAGAALLASAPTSSCADDLQQAEILHSINLLGFAELTGDPETHNPEMELKKQLLILYEQRKSFAHPTPSEQPADYEPEELEFWADLNSRILHLETELAKLSS